MAVLTLLSRSEREWLGCVDFRYYGSLYIRVCIVALPPLLSFLPRAINSDNNLGSWSFFPSRKHLTLLYVLERRKKFIMMLPSALRIPELVCIVSASALSEHRRVAPLLSHSRPRPKRFSQMSLNYNFVEGSDLLLLPKASSSSCAPCGLGGRVTCQNIQTDSQPRTTVCVLCVSLFRRGPDVARNPYFSLMVPTTTKHHATKSNPTVFCATVIGRTLPAGTIYISLAFMHVRTRTAEASKPRD